MAQKENLLNLITEIFEESIYAIRGSGVSPVDRGASNVVERVRNGEIQVALGGARLRIPTVTGFELIEITPDPSAKFAPAIVLDAGKVLGASQDSLKADLVRTIATAQQFPFAGFERRYREIYEEALETQAAWLESTHSGEIPFDPRTAEKEKLLLDLLGEARFFSDVGFADWQEVIKEYRESEAERKELPLLKELEQDKEHFLAVRQRFLPLNHETAMRRSPEVYLNQWDDRKRTKAMAGALLGISLYAR